MRNRIIIGLLIVLVVSLSIGASTAFSLFGKEDTSLAVISNDTVDQGDDLNISLTKVNGDPIDNATVNITLTDEDGSNLTFSVLTNKSGIAKLQLNDSGDYLVNCTYGGNDDLKECNATQNLTVNSVEDDSADADSGAFYSGQAERVISTGEIHDAPDGHRYQHMGNNEWKQID